MSLTNVISINTSTGVLTTQTANLLDHTITVRAENSLGSTTAALGVTVEEEAVVAGALYVATTGNDTTGDGTAGNPWLTPAHAMGQMVAGDTLYLRGGTYAGFAVSLSGTGAGSVRAGTQTGSPVAIRGYPNETVVIDGNLGRGGARGVVEIRNKNWVILSDMEIFDGTTDVLYIEGASGSQTGHHILERLQVHECNNAGLYICGQVMGGTPNAGEYRTVDILVDNCEVWDTNNPDRTYPWNVGGTPNTGGNECISVGGGVDGITVRNSTIRDSFQYGVDYKLSVINGLIENNVIYNMRKHGIYLDAACRVMENITVRGNLVYNCLDNGITLAREADRGTTQGYLQTLDNIDVYNNVFSGCKRGILMYQHPGDNGANTIDNVKIRNNTFHDSGIENIRLVDFAPIVTNFVLANNIAFDSVGTNVVNEFTGTTGYVGVGNVTSNPTFTAPGATPPNLRISTGSSAEGAGNATYAPATDFDGVTRGTPPDAGAFEVA